MKQLSSQQLLEAFQIWYRSYDHKVCDAQVLPFLADEISANTKGCLRDAREALFLATGQMAARLEMSRSGYAKLERKEQIGAISISTLARVAEAMGCELVYSIRPKKKLRFSEIIWQKLLPESVEHGWVRGRPDRFKARALAAIARNNMSDVHFRKQQSWSEK
jgi:transcriptional regulator with XRE-family HTH domain